MVLEGAGERKPLIAKVRGTVLSNVHSPDGRQIGPMTLYTTFWGLAGITGANGSSWN